MATSNYTRNYNKLRDLLQELFRMDQADLDFGIYRIMNQKRDEINRFLDEDLLPQVKQAFSHYQSAGRVELERELEDTIQQVSGLGFDPEESSKVQELREKLERTANVVALEEQVFSHLHRFFSRYYDNGDFMSLRRYKEGVYAIPYEGEEVKLHWANADQYYIKTAEHFTNYTFVLPDGRRVHFEVVAGSTEQNNNKPIDGKERRFVLTEEDPVIERDGALIVRFEYRPVEGRTRQDRLNKEITDTVMKSPIARSWLDVLQTPVPTERNKDRTLFEKHLQEYTARNTFDYFIHKDLGGFLRRELDFYIKNEVMHLDDIEDEAAPRVEQYLSLIKVLRKIAHKIIAFLEQLENFQKKLWLKKKFVLETQYCITLDRIPEEFYEEIAANEAQREEWTELFAIDEIEEDLVGPGYSVPLTVEFLKANQNLVLDTRHFTEDFKQRLIASFDDLDEQCDGLLIHSENFQALNVIKKRYKEKVQCIYIDPPYNTAATQILYKNDYKHSSWMSLMSDRLLMSKAFMSKAAVKVIAIDDVELVNLSMLLDLLYTDFRKTRTTIVHNPKGSITRDFNRVHEYSIFLTRDETGRSIARTLEKNDRPRPMRRWGANSSREERPLSFYPIYVKGKRITRVGEVPARDYHPEDRNVILETGEVEVWPIDRKGIERRWNFGLDTIHENLDRIQVRDVAGGLDLFVTHEYGVPKTVWTGGKYDAGKYGNTLLVDILGQKLFDYPKSIHLVKRCVSICTNHFNDAFILDYFGGSGTTGHAVIELNREDDGERRYILVEMGNYFDTVMKPRIVKAVYASEWKDGKPQARDTGISHFIKYIRLESYEDTLNNLQLTRTDDQTAILETNVQFREDYMLSYMLDFETRGSQSLLNIDGFKKPDAYTLKVQRDGETHVVNVDLVETLNWLLGLQVNYIDFIRGVRVIDGVDPEGNRVLILWRDTEVIDNDALDEWFHREQYSTRDLEYDIIYVNGDNNLENWRREDETWKVRLIEETFHRLMFDTDEI